MKKIVCLIFAAALAFVPVEVCALKSSAKAAIVINGDTGEVLWSKNCDTRLPMASTTKIMTALMLCEYGNFDKEITVTPEMVAVEGSSMGLLPGDIVTLHDLLYGMMLASGNDAANVTAFVLGGSVEGFVSMMNERAGRMGLKDTSFATPSGLDSEGHYTTARELAEIARQAMKNEEFRKAAASESAQLCYGNPPYKRTLKNHNKLLKSYEGAVGVKTGFTKKSGRCLVSAAQRDGKLVIAVTLNDPDDWQDHKAMLDYGLSAVGQIHYTPEKSRYKVSVVSGIREEISVEIPPLLINTLNSDKISSVVSLPEFIYAPVEKDDTIGRVDYYFDGDLIESISLVAVSDTGISQDEDSPFREIWCNILYILRELI